MLLKKRKGHFSLVRYVKKCRLQTAYCRPDTKCRLDLGQNADSDCRLQTEYKMQTVDQITWNLAKRKSGAPGVRALKGATHKEMFSYLSVTAVYYINPSKWQLSSLNLYLHWMNFSNIQEDNCRGMATGIDQFRYIKIQPQTIDRPQYEALGNKPHKLCIYSPEPRSEVYCLRLNFNILKLVYCWSHSHFFPIF